MISPRSRVVSLGALATLAALLFGVLLLGNLGHPLLWNDEGFTAMFGRRVLDYGYPKVHGDRNVLYGLDTNVAVGTKEGPDAYLGTPWVHYYVAAVGVKWADAATELHSRTARTRAPFALAGMLAMALFVGAGWRIAAGRRTRQLAVAAAFTLLSATSVSLLLHLREVRYYALSILLCGWVFWLEARSPSDRSWRHEAALVVALVLLFLTFFPAFFALVGALLLWRAGATRRDARGSPGRRLLWATAPILGALVLVVPLLVFFETISVARALSSAADWSVADSFVHLGQALALLARSEVAVAALLARLLLLVADAGANTPASSDALAARRFADLLWLFVVTSLAVGARNPLFFERYYVGLGPVLSLALCLDAVAAWEAWGRRSSDPRRGRGLQLVVLGAALLGLMVARAPYLSGRLHEIRHPLRGPLDFVVPYLANRFPDTRSLVIATNYEEPVLMYYLDSHVIVGFTGANLRDDLRRTPDVIVPRRHWARHKRELSRMLGAGDFERVRFPIEDLQYNNRPALAEHRFRARAPDREEDRMEIFVRRGS